LNKTINLQQIISIHQLKNTQQKVIIWIKRIGWVGFAFFLLKGLAWIAVWMGLTHLFD